MKLEFPNIKHKNEYENLIKNWGAYEKIPTSPSKLFYGNNFEEFLSEVNRDLTNNSRGVNSSLFFLIENGNIIGSLQIRHHIDHPNLIEDGGHIGYGIAPSFRKKGYATKMLELGLIEAKNIGLSNVLITCDLDNIGSNKVIRKNGGKLERKTKNGTRNRYLIKL